MIFDNSPKILAHVDQPIRPARSFSRCASTLAILNRFSIYPRENARSDLYAILALRYCLAFYTYIRQYRKAGCHLKDVAVQRNVPSSSLRPLECSLELPSSDRSLEVSRPARILDTIDCRHPASRATGLKDRSTISFSSLSVLD